MIKTTLLIAAAAFAGVVAAEPAGEHAGHAASIEALAKAADTNGDGTVDATELAAVTDEATKAKLVEADANGDGKIEAAEIAGAKKGKKEKKEKKEKKAEGGAGE